MRGYVPSNANQQHENAENGQHMAERHFSELLDDVHTV